MGEKSNPLLSEDFLTRRGDYIWRQSVSKKGEGDCSASLSMEVFSSAKKTRCKKGSRGDGNPSFPGTYWKRFSESYWFCEEGKTSVGIFLEDVAGKTEEGKGGLGWEGSLQGLKMVKGRRSFKIPMKKRKTEKKFVALTWLPGFIRKEVKWLQSLDARGKGHPGVRTQTKPNRGRLKKPSRHVKLAKGERNNNRVTQFLWGERKRNLGEVTLADCQKTK